MKTSKSLTKALLGIWVGSLLAFVPAFGNGRPDWATPTFGQHKTSYNAEKFREEAPAEWEFLGYSAKELHARYDEMSSCQPEPTRFWFHGCGGIEGGGFIEVKYGEDGKVEEARYCQSGCTYTYFGKYFGDKTSAIQNAIDRNTKNIQDHIERNAAVPVSLCRQLKSRAKAYNALGKPDLAARDLQLVERLTPLVARYDGAGDVLKGSLDVPLNTLAKVFERNGFQMEKISAHKYKFFKVKGSSFVVTANSRKIVKGEEAVWFLHDEIGKEASQVVRL